MDTGPAWLTLSMIGTNADQAAGAALAVGGGDARLGAADLAGEGVALAALSLLDRSGRSTSFRFCSVSGLETAVLSPLCVADALDITPGAWVLIVPSGPRCSGCLLLIDMYMFT